MAINTLNRFDIPLVPNAKLVGVLKSLAPVGGTIGVITPVLGFNITSGGNGGAPNADNVLGGSTP